MEKFWYLLGGKSEYPSQKQVREPETDPHLFSSSLSQGKYQLYLLSVCFFPNVSSIQQQQQQQQSL
jgi:hypothetical protein